MLSNNNKMVQSLGLGDNAKFTKSQRRRLQRYINLKLASSGQPICPSEKDVQFFSVSHDLLDSYREKSRLLADYLCPVDQRIQAYLSDYLGDVDGLKIPRLPSTTIILDRHGVARELSLPVDGDRFQSDIVTSYRVRQGVVHNPASDRRTTEGSFHVVEGGLPIPGDKKAVPKLAFGRLLTAALSPPDDLLMLPFTSGHDEPAHIFVSTLLRPVICPAIPGVEAEKSMEIRFFAPGNLVSNLDFVESIFGNGGNPYLTENDASLDVEHWSGHTGCVILAPHLTRMTKYELGLPRCSDATDRQLADGMCWESEDELYNNGNAFKITARDETGVIVTLVADNYYGYCKKEVKTQISFAANLYGLAEEEHAGGALAFQSRSHGEEYGVDTHTRDDTHSFSEMVAAYGELMDVHDEGYAIDRTYPDLIFIPRDIRMDLSRQIISWTRGGKTRSIKLQPGKVYMQPNGYKVEMKKHPGAPSWRLVGTDPEGVLCHKPSTVSGGGKSEISKSIEDAVIYGPIFVADLKQDLDQVQALFERDYSDRLKPEFAHEDADPTRKPFTPLRSLGSVIKLLTPSPSYTDSYNEWLETIPSRIRALVFIIKRMCPADWGEGWRDHMSVDIVNGAEAHELKLNGRKLVASNLRVGLGHGGSWRIYKVRQDFMPAAKVQFEDDITASVVVPTTQLSNTSPMSTGESAKLIKNCEYRLFQRPDDAIHKGFDKQTELDMSGPGNFMANFEPLNHESLSSVVEDVVGFQSYTTPMRTLLQKAYDSGEGFVVSSAHPRLVNGKPSKNPRYLQIRPDLQQPLQKYVSEMGTRFQRRLPVDVPVIHPVNAVLCGRRNNPPEPGIRPLAVYNPIHYQELPELFMDFISSLTGKSPSTTGAGSEGALTKGPFNALRPTVDLNNTLVSFILTGYAGFSSAAGHVGPDIQVDHDISLLVPEIWCRLTEQERDPEYMIDQGYLEAVEDFEHQGKLIAASRLGYRITDRFVHEFMGKIFDSPDTVFDEAILKPETQNFDVYVDGIENIIEAHQKVAQTYLSDGSIEDACPPLKALLYIMAEGSFEEHDIHHPDIRGLFNRDSLLASPWYQARLHHFQEKQISLWQRHVHSIEKFLKRESHAHVADRLDLPTRLAHAKKRLWQVKTNKFLESIQGTIGADTTV